MLAQAWAELRENQVRAKAQAVSAATQLEEAFKEMEGHWHDAHRMNC